MYTIPLHIQQFYTKRLNGVKTKHLLGLCFIIRFFFKLCVRHFHTFMSLRSHDSLGQGIVIPILQTRKLRKGVSTTSSHKQNLRNTYFFPDSSTASSTNRVHRLNSLSFPQMRFTQREIRGFFHIIVDFHCQNHPALWRKTNIK